MHSAKLNLVAMKTMLRTMHGCTGKGLEFLLFVLPAHFSRSNPEGPPYHNWSHRSPWQRKAMIPRRWGLPSAENDWFGFRWETTQKKIFTTLLKSLTDHSRLSSHKHSQTSTMHAGHAAPLPLAAALNTRNSFIFLRAKRRLAVYHSTLFAPLFCAYSTSLFLLVRLWAFHRSDRHSWCFQTRNTTGKSELLYWQSVWRSGECACMHSCMHVCVRTCMFSWVHFYMHTRAYVCSRVWCTSDFVRIWTNTMRRFTYVNLIATCAVMCVNIHEEDARQVFTCSCT